MAFDFELTISGLCLIILKTRDKKDKRPEHPEEVHVVCVGTPGHAEHHGHPPHRPLLSFQPEEVFVEGKVPDLFVDPVGRRIAAIDLSHKAVSFGFRENQPERFSLQWAPSERETPPEESWMDWVPTVDDLGFKEFRLEQGNGLPRGAGAQIFLPPGGELFSRNVVRDPDTGNHLLWEFPASEARRALANEVVYRARGVDHLHMTCGDATLNASQNGGMLLMSISNDLAIVPPEYRSDEGQLEHLGQLQDLNGSQRELAGRFRPPVLAPNADNLGRTGRPICNQVLFVDTI